MKHIPTALLLATPLLAGAAPPVVVFPGPIRTIAAPDRSGVRVYYRPRWDGYGGQAHPVFLKAPRGRARRIGIVTRSMGVGWSPGGRRLFLQDNWGSDVSDCRVLTRRSQGVGVVSLFRLIQRAPGRPTGDERPGRSHYYVRCDRWLSLTRVAGAVGGHTDHAPSHGFEHRFVYDARRGRIRWLR